MAGHQPEADQIVILLRPQRVEPHRLRRRIMAFELAGRLDLRIVLPRDDRQAAGLLQHRGRDWAGAQQADAVRFGCGNGRFQPFAGRAFVQDHADLAVEAGQHMLGPAGADRSAAIGRRRRQRPTTLADQRAHRRMGRQAQRHGRQAGHHQRRQAAIGPHRQHHGQRARPEAGGKLLGLGREIGQPPRHLHVGDMDDQRVEAGPPLGAVDARDRLGIGGIGRQAIDGFGGNGDGLAGADQQGCLAKRFRAIAADPGGKGWIWDSHDPRDIDPGTLQ